MGKNAKSFELGMSDSGTQHTHTVVLLIHSFSMKSEVSECDKEQKTTWLTNVIPFPFHSIAFQFVTEKEHCTHTVRQIGSHFNFSSVLLFHFIFVSRKFLRTEKWIWWSYLMALCSAKCCLNSSQRVVRFDYDLEKWVFISSPTFNISVMYKMRELNPH